MSPESILREESDIFQLNLTVRQFSKAKSESQVDKSSTNKDSASIFCLLVMQGSIRKYARGIG